MTEPKFAAHFKREGVAPEKACPVCGYDVDEHTDKACEDYEDYNPGASVVYIRRQKYSGKSLSWELIGVAFRAGCRWKTRRDRRMVEEQPIGAFFAKILSALGFRF